MRCFSAISLQVNSSVEILIRNVNEYPVLVDNYMGTISHLFLNTTEGMPEGSDDNQILILDADKGDILMFYLYNYQDLFEVTNEKCYAYEPVGGHR